MSAHDAHYGGDLVDGARLLALFGDVATELCIRESGDEGLFAGYESIAFLAPVHAGDYVEAVRPHRAPRQAFTDDGVRSAQSHRSPTRPLAERSRRAGGTRSSSAARREPASCRSAAA